MFPEEFRNKNLVEAVHAHLSQQNYNRSIARNKVKTDIRFYPSSIGQCERNIVYQMLGYVGKPKDGNDLLILENGTYFHNRMEHIFRDMGIMIAEELSLKDKELAISGRSDAIIWDLDLPVDFKPDKTIDNISLVDTKGKVVYNGHPDFVKIIEFKSINTTNFGKLKRVAKPNHVKQLQLYFYLTGIKKGAIYYEDKNNQSHKMFEVVYDQAIVDTVLADIKRYVELARANTLPERPFAPTDIPCRFCQYRETCHPNSNPFRYEDLFESTEDVPF